MKLKNNIKKDGDGSRQAVGPRVMSRHCSVTVMGCLLMAAAASGAVNSGIPHPQIAGIRKTVVPSAQNSFAGAFTSLAAAQNSFAGGNPNPGVHPPNSKPYGLSYGEWTARWWQWILQIPAAANPNLDTTGAHCAEGQSGQVWFLGGGFPGALPSSVTRECTIPAGKSLMLPSGPTYAAGAGLLDCEGPFPYHIQCADFVFNGKTGVDGLREEAKVNTDNPVFSEIIVDGVPLSNLVAYRAQSPIFSYSLTTDNIISFLLALYGLPGPEAAKTYAPAVSDGYWVIFNPMAPGIHTISGPDPAVGITYRLTVLP